jgi:hypothetical protein
VRSIATFLWIQKFRNVFLQNTLRFSVSLSTLSKTLAQKKSELKMFGIFDVAFFQLPVNDAEKNLPFVT